MKRICIVILSVGWCVFTGCAPRPSWVEAGAQRLVIPDQALSQAVDPDDTRPSNRWAGHVTAYAVSRPQIPNARLQLPRVSPDGRWIAYLDRDEAGAPITPDGLITGKGLSGVSLWVRRVDDTQDAKAVALTGACWPSWSPNSRVLAFVTYGPQRHGSLGMYEVDTGTIRRLAVGLRHVMMPTIGTGGLVAVSAYGEVPDSALIFIVDPKTGQALPGPPVEHGAQLYPRWVGLNTLLYIELSQDTAYLKRWALGDDQPTNVAKLTGPESIFDAQHMLAGIGNPLRTDVGAYAYYNLTQDRVEMLDLATLTVRQLPKGFRGGAWWGGDWFIAGADDRVELASSLRTSGDTDQPRMIRLLTGRWLPIWANHEQQAVLLVGEGDTPARFKLMQVWLSASDQD